jgi:hypothetical protein
MLRRVLLHGTRAADRRGVGLQPGRRTGRTAARKALAPGSYRVTLTPSFSTLVGGARTLRFGVVR